jgi:FkbM family methyltransferase
VEWVISDGAEKMSQVSQFAEFWKGAPPRVIFEAGARDCKDTLEFHRLFPKAQIYAFECNPATLPKCRDNVRGIDQIYLIEKAVTSEPGMVKFYPVKENAGASSLYRASGNYPVETLTQEEITVETTTFAQVIEENDIESVDILWLDMQGGELDALHGMGFYLLDVDLIMCEVMFQAIYTRQPLFEDVHKYLTDAGFQLEAWPYRDHWFGNAIYERVKNE